MSTYSDLTNDLHGSDWSTYKTTQSICGQKQKYRNITTVSILEIHFKYIIFE